MSLTSPTPSDRLEIGFVKQNVLAGLYQWLPDVQGTFDNDHGCNVGLLAATINGGAAALLQIVPTLDSVNTVTPGQLATVDGSGFTEGLVTMSFGGVLVVDGGPDFNDGVDCFFGNGHNNGRCQATVPVGGSAPVTVTTEGGTSNAVSP